MVDPKKEEQDHHQQAAAVLEVEAVGVTVPPHQDPGHIRQIQDHILRVPRTVPTLLHRHIPVDLHGRSLVVQEAVANLLKDKARDQDHTVKAQGQAGHYHIRVVKVEERIVRVESRKESARRRMTRKFVHLRLWK